MLSESGAVRARNPGPGHGGIIRAQNNFLTLLFLTLKCFVFFNNKIFNTFFNEIIYTVILGLIN